MYIAKQVISMRQMESSYLYQPPQPRTPEETGLPFLLLVELVVKILFEHGQVRLIDLANFLKLPATVIEPVIVFLRSEQLCEVHRKGGAGTDADLIYHLTDAGRVRAAEYISRNAYAGPAPVTLSAYSSQIQKQSLAHLRIDQDDVMRAFDGIVINPGVRHQLGVAMNSGRAIFIHGPAGSGKTFLAERLKGVLSGDVLVPYALLVDDEIVQIYDAMFHKAVRQDVVPTDIFGKFNLGDARWVRCERPAVVNGGELTLSLLELQFDHGTRFYRAPPHLKANNGIFIIDDLGRQQCSAVRLMNRWIVPLDRQVDFLTLHTGYKFCVPFDVVVVFSSNFPPAELLDPSLLRRIGYKIHVGALSESEYRSIFCETCERFGIPFEEEAFHTLLQEHYYREGRPLLACHPRDLLEQIRDLAIYHNKSATLDAASLDWAWNNYFIGD